MDDEFEGQSLVNERFIEVLEEMKFKKIISSQKEFAKKIGVTASYVSDIKTRPKKNVTVKMIYNSSVEYPQMNIDYILTGKGKKLKPTTYEESHNAATEEYYNKSQEDPGEYINAGDGSFEYEDKDQEIARLKGVIYGLQYSLNQMIKHKDEEKQESASKQTAEFSE